MKWCMHLWLLVAEGPGDSLCVGVWSELLNNSKGKVFTVHLALNSILSSVLKQTFGIAHSPAQASSHNARHSFPAFLGKQW